MSALAIAAACFGIPALVLFMGTRLALVDRIGAVVVCYAAGIILGNTGLLPPGADDTLDLVTSAAIPIALPLVFFSLDVRRWAQSGRDTLLAFGLEVISVLVLTGVGFLLFSDAIGSEAADVGGMLTGVYTGGTINMAAVGTALRVQPSLYLGVNASEIVASAVYLLFLVTIGPRMLGWVLPAYRPRGLTAGGRLVVDQDSYADPASRQRAIPLLGALALSVAIAGCGIAAALVLPEAAGTIVAVLLVTTLGIAASFVPRVREVRGTYQLGEYFVLVFCFAIGALADLSELTGTSAALFGFVVFALFGSMALHLLLCVLFRIDRDTMIITSVAGICSPPFVPMVASALKNREIVVSGVLTGIIGWVIGTYLGIAWASILLAMS